MEPEPTFTTNLETLANGCTTFRVTKIVEGRNAKTYFLNDAMGVGSSDIPTPRVSVAVPNSGIECEILEDFERDLANALYILLGENYVLIDSKQNNRQRFSEKPEEPAKVLFWTTNNTARYVGYRDQQYTFITDNFEGPVLLNLIIRQHSPTLSTPCYQFGFSLEFLSLERAQEGIVEAVRDHIFPVIERYARENYQVRSE